MLIFMDVAAHFDPRHARVRMDFLAVSPDVHSIDTLTLTDVETGFAMNLR